MKRTLVIVLTVLTSLSTQAQQPQSRNTAWWAHVEALANDGMEGRNTGSPGHKRAADYVAGQFRYAGLEPAGTGGYFQPVKFKTRRIVESASSLSLVRNGSDEPLRLGEDANISMRTDPAPAVEGPLVFAGYGLRIPESGIDDLAGLNLKGAVVVYISATPKSLPDRCRLISVPQPNAGRCTRRRARLGRSALRTRKAATFRGSGRRSPGSSRRCRLRTHR